MLSVAVAKQRGAFRLDVRFELPTPGVVALFGPSGCGKTTAVNLIAGLLRPDRGRVTLDDTVLFDSERRIDVPVEKRRIGYVFQDARLFPHLSVAGNLKFAERRAARAGSIGFDRVAGMLELQPLMARRIHQLSGGERQRLALARALLVASGVLIMDEATSALDNVTAAAVHESLRESGRWRTLIIIAHRIPRLTASDRVLLLDKGKVAHYGTHAVLAASCTEYRELITEQARCGVQSEINR